MGWSGRLVHSSPRWRLTLQCSLLAAANFPSSSAVAQDPPIRVQVVPVCSVPGCRAEDGLVYVQNLDETLSIKGTLEAKASCKNCCTHWTCTPPDSRPPCGKTINSSLEIAPSGIVTDTFAPLPTCCDDPSAPCPPEEGKGQIICAKVVITHYRGPDDPNFLPLENPNPDYS